MIGRRARERRTLGHHSHDALRAEVWSPVKMTCPPAVKLIKLADGDDPFEIIDDVVPAPRITMLVIRAPPREEK